MRRPKYDPTRAMIAWDTETALFGPGNMAPALTCVSAAWRDAAGRVQTALLSHREGLDELEEVLDRAARSEVTIAGQNIAYDFAVVLNERPRLFPKIRAAYQAGSIHDTMIAEWLIDTALGMLRAEMDEETGEYKMNKSYGLENLTRLYLGWPPYKDEWRMRYGELRDVPVEQYPEAARVYPKKDAQGTLLVAEAQRVKAARMTPADPIEAALAHTCRSYLALHLTSVWGQELDPARVGAIARCIDDHAATLVPSLQDAGLIVRTRSGKNEGKLTKKTQPIRDLVVLDAQRRGVIPADCDFTQDLSEYVPAHMLTDGGKSGRQQIKIAHEVLVECADPLLRQMAELVEIEKLRTAFVGPAQKFGQGPIHSRYNYAETGRTTCSGGGKRSRTGFNVQQMPRKLPKALVERMLALYGEEIDFRSCFVPRDGFVMSSSDYSALEMCTFAQICNWIVGSSELMIALNNDVDPHTLFAASLLDTTYEDALARVKAGDKEAKEMRQRAKVANFGYPGGMGAEKFLKYAKMQGISMTLDESYRLRDLYKARWSEVNEYFGHIGDLVAGGEATIVQFGSDRISGGNGYTDSCNRYFQGLAADGATDALWEVVCECYDETVGSALYGSRVVAFIHDEILAEHPRERAHEAATRLADIMRDVMQEWTPDVKIKVEPALMDRWFKAAETVRDEHGRLQVWQPKKLKEAA